jgi:hypothetical protein
MSGEVLRLEGVLVVGTTGMVIPRELEGVPVVGGRDGMVLDDVRGLEVVPVGGGRSGMVPEEVLLDLVLTVLGILVLGVEAEDELFRLRIDDDDAIDDDPLPEPDAGGGVLVVGPDGDGVPDLGPVSGVLVLELNCTVELVVGTLAVVFMSGGGGVAVVEFVVAHVLVSVVTKVIRVLLLLGNVNGGGGGTFEGRTVGTEPVPGGVVGV